jgi:hypothetical protein
MRYDGHNSCIINCSKTSSPHRLARGRSLSESFPHLRERQDGHCTSYGVCHWMIRCGSPSCRDLNWGGSGWDWGNSGSDRGWNSCRGGQRRHSFLRCERTREVNCAPWGCGRPLRWNSDELRYSSGSFQRDWNLPRRLAQQSENAIVNLNCLRSACPRNFESKGVEPKLEWK